MKILLVTGASSDSGTALLRHIVCRYDLVWAHYRQMNDALMELYQASPEKIRLVQADFLKRQDVEAMARIIFESRQIPNHIVHFRLTNIHFPIFTARNGKYMKGICRYRSVLRSCC